MDKSTMQPKKKYAVLLFEDDARWAMAQDGGLSLLLRRILRKERQSPAYYQPTATSQADSLRELPPD